MQAQPEAFVFSVSQNDWDNYCECDKCQALAKPEDSQMAPVLQLVNRVAEAVEKEFPDKAVETLAYQWTRQAAEDDAAAAERDHAAVLDRVLLLASAGHVRQPGEPGVLRGRRRPGPRSATGSGSGTT